MNQIYSYKRSHRVKDKIVVFEVSSFGLLLINTWIDTAPHLDDQFLYKIYIRADSTVQDDTGR